MRHVMSLISSLSIVLHTLKFIHVSNVGHPDIFAGGTEYFWHFDTPNLVLHQLKYAHA